MIQGLWNLPVVALLVLLAHISRPRPVMVEGAPARVGSILFTAEQEPSMGIEFDRPRGAGRVVRFRGDYSFTRPLGGYVTYGDTLHLIESGCLLTVRGARLYDPRSCVEPGVVSYRTRDEDPTL